MGLLYGYTCKMGEDNAEGQVLAWGLIINCQSGKTEQHLLFVIVGLFLTEKVGPEIDPLAFWKVFMQPNFE